MSPLYFTSDRWTDSRRTRATHSRQYSLIKLLKYWFRNSSAGPTKAKSLRCISLFVIWATCQTKQTTDIGLTDTNAVWHWDMLQFHQLQRTRPAFTLQMWRKSYREHISAIVKACFLPDKTKQIQKFLL